MQKAFHPRNDMGRLHVSRKEEKDSVEESIRRLEDYLKSGEEDWLQWPETIQTTQASAEQK